MLTGCIANDAAGRLARAGIKRFLIFESELDADDLSAAMNEWWKEKHGHSLLPTTPKRPRRYKVSEGTKTKYCNGCESDLSRSAFCVDRSRRDGLSNRCRDCASKRWKKLNGQLCESCGGVSVGQTCRRCLTIKVRVRDTEYEAISTIPLMFARASRELEEFMKSLSPNLSRDQRLSILIARVCGT